MNVWTTIIGVAFIFICVICVIALVSKIIRSFKTRKEILNEGENKNG